VLTGSTVESLCEAKKSTEVLCPKDNGRSPAEEWEAVSSCPVRASAIPAVLRFLDAIALELPP